MSNVFEVLKRMGGVVVENGVTYVTSPNPPANDDSQKIATTAWVKDITDGLEASVSGGMFPKIQHAVADVRYTRVPNGGTWWVLSMTSSVDANGSYSGGTLLHTSSGAVQSGFLKNFMCIKIA